MSNDRGPLSTKPLERARRVPATAQKGRKGLDEGRTAEFAADLEDLRQEYEGRRIRWVPYAEGLLGELAQRANVISEHARGLDLFVDLEALDEAGVERAKKRLAEALLALTVRSKPGTSLQAAR